MIGEVLDVIALGRKLIETIGNLRRDVQSARAVQPQKSASSAHVELLENRIGAVEARAKEHDDRLAELEQSLEDTLRATEALAQRVSAIFWIAIAGCGLAVIALVASAVALTRTLR
jgi:hypothetical protein